ncbi:type II toxin-antitoxin system PemK/MazF family toxin [Paenibacillus donghaensis]|nr:type II toxin-antitoxin system PemK/MazF family toxin [Paenibacillus donghaensis]
MSMVMERAESIVTKQFDIFLADLGESKGSVQRGVRPSIVISNDRSNLHSNFVVVCPITSSMTKAKLPTHVYMKANEIGFHKDSVVLFEQHFTIDKSLLIHKITDMPKRYERELERALIISTTRTFSRT